MLCILRRIIDRIKYLCPKAHLIFALTTKVIEPGFEPGIMVGERRNADIQRYNKIAKCVCANMKIAVNDLWSVSDCISEKAHSDMVHFETEIGIHALGTQVAECLKQYCGG